MRLDPPPDHGLAIPALPQCIAGTLVRYSDTDQPVVDFPGNPADPVPARTIMPPTESPRAGTSVMLVFERGDPGCPIILGVVRGGFATDTPQSTRAALETTQELHLHAKRLVVDAEYEIALRCGRASLTIHPDGTVVLKGTNLLSRSSGPNRIKGASVQIN